MGARRQRLSGQRLQNHFGSAGSWPTNHGLATIPTDGPGRAGGDRAAVVLHENGASGAHRAGHDIDEIARKSEHHLRVDGERFGEEAGGAAAHQGDVHH